MKRVLRVVAVCILCGLLVSCGGSSSQNRSARITLSVTWPDRSRLVPLAATVVHVFYTEPTTCPDGPQGPRPCTKNELGAIQIPDTTLDPVELPSGKDLTIYAEAYPLLPVSGTPPVYNPTSGAPAFNSAGNRKQAGNAVLQNLTPGETRDIPIKMDSTVKRIDLAVTKNGASVVSGFDMIPSDKVTATATAYDQPTGGSLVMIADGSLYWSSSSNILINGQTGADVQASSPTVNIQAIASLSNSSINVRHRDGSPRQDVAAKSFSFDVVQDLVPGGIDRGIEGGGGAGGDFKSLNDVVAFDPSGSVGGYYLFDVDSSAPTDPDTSSILRFETDPSTAPTSIGSTISPKVTTETDDPDGRITRNTTGLVVATRGGVAVTCFNPNPTAVKWSADVTDSIAGSTVLDIDARTVQYKDSSGSDVSGNFTYVLVRSGTAYRVLEYSDDSSGAPTARLKINMPSGVDTPTNLAVDGSRTIFLTHTTPSGPKIAKVTAAQDPPSGNTLAGTLVTTNLAPAVGSAIDLSVEGILLYVLDPAYNAGGATGRVAVILGETGSVIDQALIPPGGKRLSARGGRVFLTTRYGTPPQWHVTVR